MSKTFRLSEVAEHNVTKGENKSVWLAIHDKVYDVTKFLDEVREREIERNFFLIFLRGRGISIKLVDGIRM